MENFLEQRYPLFFYLIITHQGITSVTRTMRPSSSYPLPSRARQVICIHLECCMT